MSSAGGWRVGVSRPFSLWLQQMQRFNVKQLVNKNGFAYVAIAMVIALVYSRAISYNFVVWDDPVYLTMNPDVWNLGAENLKNILFGYYNGNYHPVTMLLYAILYKAFALNSYAYHIFNILMHIVNTFMVYLLLREFKITKNLSLFCCLVWALHPQRVEAVAWVVGLKDVVATIFCIMFILVYKRTADKNNSYDAITLFILYALAVLAKGTSVVVLAYIFTDDVFTERRQYAQRWRFKLALALFSVFIILQNILARAEFQGILMEHKQDVLLSALQGVYRLGIYYIASAFSPFHISLSPYLAGGASRYLWGIAGLFVVAAFIGSVRYFGKNERLIKVFGLCYVLSYLPSIFLPVVGYTMDRFSYFPTIWFVMCLGVLLQKHFSFSGAHQKQKYIAASIIVLLCAGVTSGRVGVWKDSITLWEDAIALYGGKKGQEQNLAWAYDNLGWYYNATEQYEKSIPYIIKAIEIDSTPIVYHENFAEALIELTEYVKATEQIKLISESQPGNLYSYSLMARMVKKSGADSRSLIGMLEHDVDEKSRDYRYYYYLACLYANIKNYELAIKRVEMAREFKSNDIDINLLLAELNYKSNRREEAMSALDVAKKIDKENFRYRKLNLLYGYSLAEKDIYLKN